MPPSPIKILRLYSMSCTSITFRNMSNNALFIRIFLLSPSHQLPPPPAEPKIPIRETGLLSPYSTKKRVGVGSSLRHLTHEMYMPNAKTRRQAPNATYIPLEYRLRLLPNAKKSTQKKKKCTWPTQETCVT